jgi:hypothetical protein
VFGGVIATSAPWQRSRSVCSVVEMTAVTRSPASWELQGEQRDAGADGQV